MRANFWQNFLGITTFGESHGKMLGVVIEDVKPGINFPFAELRNLLNERKPNQNIYTSQRKEDDDFEIISGIIDGKTTGMPICILFKNKDAKSFDYEYIKNIFRPGHADFSIFHKFKIYDYRGGGRASGRETISRVAASSLVSNITKDININFKTIKIGKFNAKDIDQNFADSNPLFWPEKKSYIDVENYIKQVRAAGNSLGGIIEITLSNIPKGLGDPVFEKLDANIAKAILSIGSIKGIEFGKGFLLSQFLGKDTNDEINSFGFLSNNMGGILGGISTGEDIVLRVVVKPTPSISIPQNTIDINNEEHIISIKGRHDTIIIPRVIPVLKAMIKLVIADAIQHQRLISNKNENLIFLREAIDKIDEDILLAIKRRNEIASQIGKLKKLHNIPITDTTREASLKKALKEKCELLDLDQNEIEKIWEILINLSKNKQTIKNQH